MSGLLALDICTRTEIIQRFVICKRESECSNICEHRIISHSLTCPDGQVPRRVSNRPRSWWDLASDTYVDLRAAVCIADIEDAFSSYTVIAMRSTSVATRWQRLQVPELCRYLWYLQYCCLPSLVSVDRMLRPRCPLWDTRTRGCCGILVVDLSDFDCFRIQCKIQLWSALYSGRRRSCLAIRGPCYCAQELQGTTLWIASYRLELVSRMREVGGLCAILKAWELPAGFCEERIHIWGLGSNIIWMQWRWLS